MKKIGILFGQERTFPQAFVERINSKNVDGIKAEPVRIDKVMQGEPTEYSVIIDRISQDVPFFRAYLKNAALSNAADLYVHEGDLKKASELYEQCIRFNSCDFHSMMGLGWIALVHDGNDSQAKKIFSFVRSKLKSPDPLLKLSQANEMNDIAVSKKFAVQFAQQAANAVYGNMYNKYLIQVYTSVLNEPAKALTIAEKEMSNRRTPQTGAWLAWCLFDNGKNHRPH